MKFIQGQSRQHTSLFPITLDDAISEDNIVRIIGIFVSGLKLDDYGFKVSFDENGRPAYHPSDLLKLYIYGYMNRVRSSRGLEYSFKPDHNTISNFSMTCKVKDQCSKARYGKAIQRSEYQELIEKNKKRVKENESYYKRRQSIVEHPYGTIKRQWDFSYIMTKKYIHRAKADVGLIMTAYNLRRIINIVGVEILKEYLKTVTKTIFHIFGLIRTLKNVFKRPEFFKQNIDAQKESGYIKLILAQNLGLF